MDNIHIVEIMGCIEGNRDPLSILGNKDMVVPHRIHQTGLTTARRKPTHHITTNVAAGAVMGKMFHHACILVFVADRYSDLCTILLLLIDRTASPGQVV